MFRILPVYHNISAKPIQHHPDQAVMCFQTYGYFSAAKHPEGPGCQLPYIIIFKKFSAASHFLLYTDLLELIYLILLNPSTLLVVSDQIILLILPYKSPGTDRISFPLILRTQLLLHSPFTILKRNLPVLS